MSRERARAREARQADAARRAAEAKARSERLAERARRRARRSEALRTVVPRRGRRWSRRTRQQRSTIVLILLAIGVFTFLLIDAWTVRIAVLLVAIVATPAVVTMALDRSTR
jgi:Flp pilus assembly protein TadB